MTRKYSKCIWCGRTIDITNQDIELCNTCASFSTRDEMLKGTIWIGGFPYLPERNLEEIT